MNLAELRRKHIEWAINQNPTEIEIKRTEKKRAGGGFKEETTTHGPFVVRIFSKRTTTPREVSTLAGTKEVNTSWSLLADADVNIQASSTVKDEFEADNLGRFEVISVRPQIIDGEIVGYQAELERLS